MKRCIHFSSFSLVRNNERPLSGIQKARRSISATFRGAGTGASLGVAGRALLLKRRPNLMRVAATLPATGALAGGLIAGAARIRRDRDRDLAARITETFFSHERATISRIRESVGRNVHLPVPGASEIESMRAVAKKPLVRRIAVRAAKIAGGALAGHWAGKKIGGKAGALTGAVAGAMFSSNENHQSMDTNISNIGKSIARHAGKQLVGKFESHSFDSLPARVGASPALVTKLLSKGVLCSRGPVHRGDETGLHSFSSDHLNEVRLSVLTAVAERAVEGCNSPEQMTRKVDAALRENAKGFAAKPTSERQFSRFPKGLVRFSRDREDEPGILSRVGKVAAVGAAAYGAASYIRGRGLKPAGSVLDKLRAGHKANVGTLSEGARRVAAVLSKSRRR